MKELASAEWTVSATNADKILKMLTLIPGGLDMLADCCVICLNPFGDEAVDRPWVQKNMSSSRILNVVLAQIEVSKLRDFFSGVSRLLPQ